MQAFNVLNILSAFFFLEACCFLFFHRLTSFRSHQSWEKVVQTTEMQFHVRVSFYFIKADMPEAYGNVESLSHRKKTFEKCIIVGERKFFRTYCTAEFSKNACARN